MVELSIRGDGLDQMAEDLDEKRREVEELNGELREARGPKRLYPPYIPGVKAMVVIVSNWGEDVPTTFKLYIDMLRATYEEEYWEGEEGINVTVVGCGIRRKLPAPEYTIGGTTVKGEPVVLSDFTGRSELKQSEFVELVVDEDRSHQEYDQIHILGHGDTVGGTGLMFYWDTDKETGESVRHPFREAEATKISKRYQWPIKGGGVVILMGCELVGGGLLSFLQDVLPDCTVHGLPNIISNIYYWKDEDTGEEVAADWYYYKQNPDISNIGQKLRIPQTGF